jgi:phosphoenolpyruvate synthase/pyruvate phosphate dikinase
MAEHFAEAYADLVANTTRLEQHMRDMQDCEFTVQDGLLFMLQTRNGKRTGPAALQVGRPQRLLRASTSVPADPAAAVSCTGRFSWPRLGTCAAPRPCPHSDPCPLPPIPVPTPQVAVAMEREGMVSRAEAVLMVEPRHLDQLLHPMFEGERCSWLCVCVCVCVFGVVWWGVGRCT